MEQRKYIAIIAFLRKFMTVFFTLFFNIYILKIVNNDMNFILKYTIKNNEFKKCRIDI